MVDVDLYKPYEREAPMEQPPFVLQEITPDTVALREEFLEKRNGWFQSDRYELAWCRNWLETQYTHQSTIERRASAQAAALAAADLKFGKHHLLGGRFNRLPLGAEEQAEYEMHRKTTLAAAPQKKGQDSHMAIDYDCLLAKGCEGVLLEIQGYLSKCDEETREGVEKAAFYRACVIALEGLHAFQLRCSREAAQAASEAGNASDRDRLQRIADALANVPWKPAETFFEAVQSVHFYTFIHTGLYQLGRPDRYLLPYYRRDIQRGILTPDEAQDILDQLALMFTEYIPQGLAIGFMVGGTRAVDGGYHSVCNEITWHLIHGIRHTRLAYPGVGLCVDEGTPRAILDLAAVCLGEGLSHPALFNDATIRKGLLALGLPPEQACFYVHSTCVEITPCATSAVWVASPYHNLIQFLLDALQAGETESFDGLLLAVRRRLHEAVSREVVEHNRMMLERKNVVGYPLVSCFVRDCLETGRDVDMGGARYNWLMPSFVGLANLADALVAVNHLVYQEKRMTASELVAILNNNYQGEENLRLQILNRYPKYGNGEAEADDMVKQLSLWVQESVANHRTYHGSRVVPSLFCWVMHEYFGTRTGATPDGRLAGFPLGDGSGPAQGREKAGPTASILSATCWDHDPFIGGIAVNVKVQKSLFKPESRGALVDIIRTYMNRGGFEIQINAVDAETLLKARKNPEKYADLVVRIGGYSDYFVRLTPAMQEEVILRTGHAL